MSTSMRRQLQNSIRMFRGARLKFQCTQALKGSESYSFRFSRLK